jgi:predicted amidohydrolase YtcJ
MPAPATLLLRNARVATLDPARPWAEAVAIRGDRVLWLGPDHDAAAWAGPATRVIDGGGRLALPGLIDSHFHLLAGARALGQLRLDDAADLADVQARLLAHAVAHPAQEWLIGRGWMYRLFAGGEPIHRRALDAVAPDRPVLLTAFDGHTAWANTAALRRAGILEGADTGSAFSSVVVGDDGLATGELREAPAISLVRRLVPSLSEDEQLAMLRRALRDLAALGLTAVHNMDGDAWQLGLYRRLLERGELSLRVLLPLSLSPGVAPERIDEWAALAREQAGPRLGAGAVKLFMDGVVESKTALLLAPYADGSGELGAANYEQEEFEELVARADALDLQVFVHAIGDGAVRRTLDGFGAARARNGRRGRAPRHRVEHVELIDPADVGRFVELGAIAAMQPAHADFGIDPENSWRRLSGPARWPWGFAWRRLRDAGVRLAFGSDWPVADPSPLRGIHVCLNREPLDHGAPDQRLTLDEAIAGYTTWAAYAGHREDELGRLAPGFLADLVLLEQDIYRAPREAIGETSVALTVMGGEVVFER